MKKGVEPLGRLLLRSGALSEEMLADVLDQQRHTLPFASLCYVLGHVDEEPLCRALSKQCGVPGIVLSRSVIHLCTLASVPRDMVFKHAILPVYEDDARLFVAVEGVGDPGVLRELGWVSGKTVVPHVALHIALARAIRLGYAALDRGEEYLVGEHAGIVTPPPRGYMYVISDVDELALDGGDGSQDTRPSAWDHLGALAAPDTQPTRDGSRAGDHASMPGTLGGLTSSIELVPEKGALYIDLDEDTSTAPVPPPAPGPDGNPVPRILVVDDDFATRHLLQKSFAPDGYIVETAASGMEAVSRIRALSPDLVTLDIMLPEVDGFQICRSIKSSKKYGHIPVVMLSAVIDSGRVTDQMLARYGADAYFEKPINIERLRRKVKELLEKRAARPASVDDGTFDAALALYRSGRIDEAIETLRRGLAHDPLSTKHHFVLANLLQKKNQIYEAIDEYEATVNLKPDYFPALSRLAYLYYKKGFSAKAIETWRRSLPHCPDPELRKNIETFMRKLIATMAAEA